MLIGSCSSRTHDKSEKELYPLFVKAANVALLFLQELEVENIRPLNDAPAICFHVHDPVLLKQSHQGQVSQRKPDVIIISELDTRDAHGSTECIYSQKDTFLGVATAPPTKPFGWRSVHTFVEFKKSKNKIELPPESYTLREYVPPQEHEYLRMNILCESDLDALPTAPASSADNPRPSPLNPSE